MGHVKQENDRAINSTAGSRKMNKYTRVAETWKDVRQCGHAKPRPAAIGDEMILAGSRALEEAPHAGP